MRHILEYIINQQVNPIEVQTEKEKISEHDYWKKLFTGKNFDNAVKMQNAMLKFICCYFMKEQALSPNTTGYVLSQQFLNNSIFNIAKLLNEYGWAVNDEDVSNIISTKICNNNNTSIDWDTNIKPIINKMKNISWVSDILQKHKNLI